VEGTLPYLSPTIRAMIELQLVTGMRPGELCQLRPMDVNRDSEVWDSRRGNIRPSTVIMTGLFASAPEGRKFCGLIYQDPPRHIVSHHANLRAGIARNGTRPARRLYRTEMYRAVIASAFQSDFHARYSTWPRTDAQSTELVMLRFPPPKTSL
jgi:integrase